MSKQGAPTLGPRPDKRAQKRAEILGVTWHLIAEQGLRAANMRSIAAAAGYANGALAYYFEGKQDLLRAAFSYVFERTERRIGLATRELSGLSALRAMCREILPLDREKLLEARIVLPFWAEAAHDPSFAALHERSLKKWRGKLRRHLKEASVRGEIRSLTPREAAAAAEQLLSVLMGAQVMAVLSPAGNPPSALEGQLSRFVRSLRRRGAR